MYYEKMTNFENKDLTLLSAHMGINEGVSHSCYRCSMR